MIRNALQRFMLGRYGRDELNICLLLLYLLLYLCSLLFEPLVWVSLAALFLFLFRALSRDFSRRRSENERFLKVVRPVQEWFRLRRAMFRDKEHCYFKCPSCGQHLRVPKGKGKINVTCRSCGAVFQEKS